LIREALALYLQANAPAETSAYALGVDVFGRHRGPADLAAQRKMAAQRKKLVADAWSKKHASRRG
jgi:hypothetical protein